MNAIDSVEPNLTCRKLVAWSNLYGQCSSHHNGAVCYCKFFYFKYWYIDNVVVMNESVLNTCSTSESNTTVQCLRPTYLTLAIIMFLVNRTNKVLYPTQCFSLIIILSHFNLKAETSHISNKSTCQKRK